MIRPLKRTLRHVGLIAAIALTLSSISRSEPAGSFASQEPSAEQKAMVDALNNQLAQFETVLAKDGNEAHAETVKAALAVLKQRRDTFLKRAFDQSKYDELHFDLNVAYQRLNLWLAPPVAAKAILSTSAAKTAEHK